MEYMWLISANDCCFKPAQYQGHYIDPYITNIHNRKSLSRQEDMKSMLHTQNPLSLSLFSLYTSLYNIYREIDRERDCI